MPVNFNRLNIFTLSLLMALFSGQVLASCGSTSCSINTDWNEHGVIRPGWSTDFSYSYSRADTLRSGSKKIVADPIAAPYNTGIEAENMGTINRLLTASMDYTHDEHWGVMLQLPYVMRDHSHSIGDPNPALVTSENFTANSLGDIKVVGRYRWDTGRDNQSGMGIKFGLKLSTGRKDFVMNTGVVPDEATLQPGNGSTDLIIGAFWNQNMPGSSWSWFTQGTVQNSISSSEQFRPGNKINLDAGTRYAFNNALSGLLQINVLWSDVDTGSAAAQSPLTGEASSGMKSVAITPGVSYAFTPATQLYSLVQVPVYQYVNGEQLTYDYAVSVGISHHY
jgi:hypothetical protein